MAKPIVPTEAPTPAVSVPHPQPSQISAPVPSSGVELPSPAPTPPPDQSGGPGMTQGGEAPVGTDELFAQLEGSQAQPQVPLAAGEPSPGQPLQPDDLFAELDKHVERKKLEQQPTTEEGTGAPVKSRFIANIGKEPATQRILLQNSLGDGYETMLKENDVWFRKKGDTAFQRMDPKIWKASSEFIAEAVKDVGVDIAPDIAEAAMQSIFTALAAKAGAIGGGLAGTAAGGPAGGMVGAGAGFAGGAAAGVPIGAMGAAMVRDAIVQALGAPSEVDLKKEAVFNSLAQIGGFGLAKAFRKPTKAILDNLSDALGQSKLGRIRGLAKVREEVENFGHEYFGKSFRDVVPTGAKVGRDVENILDLTQSNLEREVGIVRNKAIALAKNNPMPVGNFQERAKEILEQQGVSFSENGIAIMPGKEVIRRLKPFGEDTGASLKQIVDDYNATSRRSGMGMLELFNTLDNYKTLARYDATKPDAANAAFKRLRGALAEDRNNALKTTIPEGSYEYPIIDRAFKNYSESIDDIRALQKQANKSPEKFAEALIAPKESRRIQQLKQVLGEDSDAFSNIKAAWMSKIMNESVDPETGIVVGSKIKSQLDKYGPDVLNELMSKEQQNVLAAISSKASKIRFDDLVTNPGQQAFFKDFVRANLNGVSSTESKVRVLWSMFGSNKDALKYLTDKGLLDIAKDIKDPLGRSRTLRTVDWLRKLEEVSQIEVKGKHKILKLPIEQPVWSGIIAASERQPDESMQEYIQRRNEAIQHLRKENGITDTGQ